MNASGIILGASTFIIIGLFHPLVIKGEYHFGVRIWPLFLLAGLLCIAVSAFVAHTIGSAVLGVIGFSFLWSIGELRHQRDRVRKGWFPANPKRPNDPA